MKMKNFKALIVTALLRCGDCAAEIFAGAGTCNTSIDVSSRDPPSNTKIIIKLILYFHLVRRVWFSLNILDDFLA